MKIFVLGEKERALRELCAGARTFGNVELIALKDEQVIEGVADVVRRIPVPANVMVEDAVDTIEALVKREAPDAIFVQPSISMKLLVGRLAARLSTSAVSSIVTVSAEGASSMFFGGLAHSSVKVQGPVAIYYIGPGIFGDAVASGTNAVVDEGFVSCKQQVEILACSKIDKSGVDLTSAKRVVGVGRGIAAEEDLGMIRELASAIGAEVGCTRPVTEMDHWMPRETYIGVSGLVIKPDIYISIGISGQSQHIVGVDTSKTIIVVNKDPNCPMFEYADYGIVGDLYNIVPKMIEVAKKI